MADTAPPGRTASLRLLLASALTLALPAALLVNESFRPFESRFRLEGRDAVHAFEVTSTEPLFLELELLLRAPADARAEVLLRVNQAPLGALLPDRLYATQRQKLMIPAHALRPGQNRLEVEASGSDQASFEMNARLHNYYGINPRFPFGVVVADESVRLAFDRMPAARGALRLGACCAASLLLLGSVLRLSRRCSPAALRALIVSTSVLPWCGVAYGLATPLQLWLSPAALLVLSLVPCLLTALALWAAAHRARVARIAVATLSTLLVVELGLRVFNHYRPSYVFYTGSYDRYRGQPGAPVFDFRLNSRGFHDAEHATARGPGLYRIVAIGDSFAVGVVPYAANYLTLLEAEPSSGPRFEVINMGIAATEPRDYLALLVGEGLAFAPDLVLVGFFVGNDFEATRRKAYEHSYVTTFLNFMWRIARAGARPAGVPAAADGGHYDDAAPSLSRDRFLEIEVDRSWIYRRPGEALAAAAPRALGYLRQMRDVSRRAGAQFLVVVIPDELQLDAELQQQVAAAMRSTPDQFAFRMPNQVIAEALTREGIPFVDLLPAFEQEAGRTRLYKPRDTHWNLAGNRLAAARIGAALRERLLSRVNENRGTAR